MKIKICGLKNPEMAQASVAAGADFIGLVFYKPSPRNIDFETAASLKRSLPAPVKAVALLVDPGDQELSDMITTVKPDMIQLHGNEAPDRVAAIRKIANLPVMKAFRIGGESDLKNIRNYEDVSDWLLFDARPEDAKLPGGTGKTFDWTLLQGQHFTKPWMLSGGLDAENIANALSILKPAGIDISSGVESAPGEKDPEKIRLFIKTVHAL